MNDLKARYIKAEKGQYIKLQTYVDSSSRIILIIDAWAGNNKLDYIIVTRHYETVDREYVIILLDILEIDEPVYSSIYLASKLLEVTDRL